jgi:hypothetical protein
MTARRLHRRWRLTASSGSRSQQQRPEALHAASAMGHVQRHTNARGHAAHQQWSVRQPFAAPSHVQKHVMHHGAALLGCRLSHHSFTAVNDGRHSWQVPRSHLISSMPSGTDSSRHATEESRPCWLRQQLRGTPTLKNYDVKAMQECIPCYRLAHTIQHGQPDARSRPSSWLISPT